MMDKQQRDHIAQWAFDTHSILGRFHLWLEDVETRQVAGAAGGLDAFVGQPLTRAFITAAAVTALGTRLFGRYGEGKGLDKKGINRVKKDADAVSAYALSEALWYLSRNLPENHALMVSLGEGLMPKAGETPEMGSNPLLGFGRVYARPQVAKFLEPRIHRLVNDDAYGWEELWNELAAAGITPWGAAIDTLENTSRFAKGSSTGPMAVLHVFDQPLQVSRPYEGYVGTLVLPRTVVAGAAARSILICYATPRRLVLEAIRHSYPDIPAERVHVWTLRGPSRVGRLGSLWREWSELGVHLVEEGWRLPGGGEVFTESGTYAPVQRVGTFEDDKRQRHLWICDGYAASAEAIQAASLDPNLGLHTAMSLFSSRFKASHEVEHRVMFLDPESPRFAAEVGEAAGGQLPSEEVEPYRDSIRAARDADMPVGQQVVTIDDFFPRKRWRVLAVVGYMLPDPYSGCPGIREEGPGTYKVTVRAATHRAITETALTFRLLESLQASRLIFFPLLDRFYAGQDYRSRPVKISDSGRIRNELQTLCSEALEYFGADGIRIHFGRIDASVLPPDKQRIVRQVLEWYKERHPLWFKWLEIAD